MTMMFGSQKLVSIQGPGPCTRVLSHVHLFETLWTVAHQAPLSMGFSRQEYCSGLPFPPPGESTHTGIEPESPALALGSLPRSHLGNPPIQGLCAVIPSKTDHFVFPKA